MEKTELRVNAECARAAVHRLAVQVAQESGFEAISPLALCELEEQAVKFIANICFFSHELAQAARRTRPNTRDMVAALEYGGFSASELTDYARARKQPEAVQMFTEPPLKQEDHIIMPYEDFKQDLTAKLPHQPTFFPSLPPKHLWKQTPVYSDYGVGDARADQVTDLSSSVNDTRVRTTRLIEASLRRLIRSTTAAVSAAPLAKATADAESSMPPVETDESMALDVLAQDAEQDQTQEPMQTDGLVGESNSAIALQAEPEPLREAHAPEFQFLDALPSITSDEPKLKLSISSGQIKVREETAQEALVNLQLLASMNQDEHMDASLVNWEMVGRKRGLAAIDMSGSTLLKGKKLRWRA